MLRSPRLLLFLAGVATAGFLLGQELSDRLPSGGWSADPVAAVRRGWGGPAPAWWADPTATPTP